jgi:hypothetical protein
MSCTHFLDALDSYLLVAYNADNNGGQGGDDVNVKADEEARAVQIAPLTVVRPGPAQDGRRGRHPVSSTTSALASTSATRASPQGTVGNRWQRNATGRLPRRARGVVLRVIRIWQAAVRPPPNVIVVVADKYPPRWTLGADLCRQRGIVEDGWRPRGLGGQGQWERQRHQLGFDPSPLFGAGCAGRRRAGSTGMGVTQGAVSWAVFVGGQRA